MQLLLLGCVLCVATDEPAGCWDGERYCDSQTTDCFNGACRCLDASMVPDPNDPLSCMLGTAAAGVERPVEAVGQPTSGCWDGDRFCDAERISSQRHVSDHAEKHHAHAGDGAECERGRAGEQQEHLTL